LDVLTRVLPEGDILEIACGSGEHAVFLAPRLPGRRWLPTDAHEAALDSTRAWISELPPEDAASLMPPQALDAMAPDRWSVTRADAILCVNMIHIAPWAACEGLMTGAGRILPHGGLLTLYGPFLRSDHLTAPSNLAFDETLRSQNPAWGIRSLDTVAAEAARHGLMLEDTIEMPSNNLTITFRKR
jgi:cyclopropane fatty-acyl-phospholipid synthase-like methyltransferase